MEYYPQFDELAKLNKSESLAQEHVDWLLKLLRPLLIEHFIHGYKHGEKTPRESQVKES